MGTVSSYASVFFNLLFNGKYAIVWIYILTYIWMETVPSYEYVYVNLPFCGNCAIVWICIFQPTFERKLCHGMNLYMFNGKYYSKFLSASRSPKWVRMIFGISYIVTFKSWLAIAECWRKPEYKAKLPQAQSYWQLSHNCPGRDLNLGSVWRETASSR